MGKTLTHFARHDKNIIGITAAMPSGTGLNILEKALPDQCFDVGIAEEHAVLFAAGMATPIPSRLLDLFTFLQRAVDPIIHDVALQKLPVLCMDRAGLSPNDGATHHGLFDIAYLRSIPHCVLMAPANEDELADMMATGLAYQGPAFIRYPRAVALAPRSKPSQKPSSARRNAFSLGQIDLWAYGIMLEEAHQVAAKLSEHGITAGVVNACFAKPLDTDALLEAAQQTKLIVTLEDHVLQGGFGSAVLEALDEAKASCPLLRLGWPDDFIEHGNNVQSLRAQYGLNPEQLFQQVLERARSIPGLEEESINDSTLS